MTKKLLSFLFTCAIITSIWAQNCTNLRYQKAVFSNISKQSDVIYGQADKYDNLGSSSLSDMKMDVYSPNNDTLSQRPLVLFFYGGAFLLGNKTDADVSAWCDSLAHYGYVVASVNYRLGMDLTNTRSSVRAVYRAVQDARAAIRYFKEFHTTYKIDTTKVYLGGESAGAFIALHTTFLNKEVDRPQETYSSSNPLDAPDDNQDLGCLDCSGNNYSHSVEISGIIDLWGALQTPNFIDANDKKVPTVLIHGTNDGIVPFTSGKPFSNLAQNFPVVYGSQPLHDRMDSLGIYNEFYPYQGLDHVFYGLPTGVVTFPNQYWEPVWTQGHEFLYKTLQFSTATPSGVQAPCINGVYTYSLPFHAGSTYCWQINNGTIIGNSTSNSIQIQWNSIAAGQIQVQEINHLQVVGQTATLNVNVQNCTSSLADNTFEMLGLKLQQTLILPNEPIVLTHNMASPTAFSFELIESTGKVVELYNMRLYHTGEVISLAHLPLPQGIYFLKASNGMQVWATKIVVTQNR